MINNIKLIAQNTINVFLSSDKGLLILYNNFILIYPVVITIIVRYGSKSDIRSLAIVIIMIIFIITVSACGIAFLNTFFSRSFQTFLGWRQC